MGEPTAPPQRLTLAEEPPDAPPELAVEGIPVPLLSAEWYSPATENMELVSPDPTDSAADLPSVHLVDDLSIQVSSDVAMARVDVSFYSRLDATGAPSGSRIDVRCSEDETTCLFARTKEGVHVDVERPENAVLAIVSLSYSLVENFDRALALGYSGNYASYGVRLG